MINDIGDGVWHVSGPPLRMPGGVWMPLASTLFRVGERELAIYSPIDIADEDLAAIRSLGDVAHVIVPSALHHRYATAAAARWPAARVHCAAGVRAKQPGLRVDHALGEPTTAWPSALGLEHVDGAPKIDEHVVFHRPSGTLACADLVFHIRSPRNLRTRAVLAMMGVGGQRLAQSRVWRLARRDVDAARASVERILAWPIARVAPCHRRANRGHRRRARTRAHATGWTPPVACVSDVTHRRRAIHSQLFANSAGTIAAREAGSRTRP